MAGVQGFKRWAFGSAAAAVSQRQLRSQRRSLHSIDAPDSPVAPKPKKSRVSSKSKASSAASSDDTTHFPKRKPSPIGFIATTPVAGDRVVYAFPALVSGKLVKRYKRFLADVQLDDDDTVVTVHCPNTGPMVGLLDIPLAPVRLSVSHNAKRKYAHTLEFIQVKNQADAMVWVGVHSASANRMVETALRNGWLPEVVGHRRITSIQPEVKHTKDSRVDFVVTTDDQVDTYVEVKSVTLSKEEEQAGGRDALSSRRRCAVFPDTVSARASKHVEELAHVRSKGHRAAVVFLVQRSDCATFAPSSLHDPAFAAHCDKAKAAGVAFHGYACAFNDDSSHVTLLGPLAPHTSDLLHSVA
ncbi:hypothetical protein DYB37_004435 [Aphanomyces astaci]|uniref:Sugar fermentation stimulation protein n=1 Tax=Aphanomyces astaci TaxID=112090 RepID=A0A418ES78_APHAT|nr:hypothetical protein DYB37_004435 [Aphanomyces astaci]